MGFLERHRVVRRLILVWVVWLISYATLSTFGGGEVTGGKAAAYATCVGLLSTILGIYFHRRHQDDDASH